YIRRLAELLDEVTNGRELFGFSVLRQVSGQQAKVDFLGMLLDPPDDSLQPFAAFLIQIMEVVDDEEIKLRRARRIFRLQGPRPQSQSQQSAAAQAEHLPTG